MASAPLVILVLAVFAVSISAQPTSRIWGGQEADKVSFPYVASVRLDNAHICGGSIIGNKSVLTAAHCVFEKANTVSPKRLSVRVGSTNQFSAGKLVYISDVHVHPEYAGVKNDIAVLTLESTLQWTTRIQKIDIASSAVQPSAGAAVSMAGWGAQSSGVTPYKLHSISTLTIATDDVCTNAYSDNDASTICLAHNLKQGSCTGDAGNGAVYNNELVGVCSFVVGACGSRYPDVFANASYYASWIQGVMV